MSVSDSHKQHGYILSSVVILSIVIFATSLIVLQYVSTVYSSIGSNIRTDSARQIANEQMQRALECAENADTYTSCAKTNRPVGSLNDYPASSTVGFTQSSKYLDITSTTTIGSTSSINDSYSVRARAPIKATNIQTVSLPETPPDDSEWVTKLSAGSNHTCALTNEKRLFCWGDNAQGQLGTGNTTAQTTPYQVGLSGVEDMDAGFYHTCAIANPNRTVYCWGWNGNGQLGTGNTTARTSPLTKTVPEITNATTISTANSHTCATTADRNLRCWGNNQTYQIGTGGKSTSVVSPYLVTNTNIINKATKVSAGHAHTCVIRTDSKAYCWGLSEQGAVTGYYAGSAINPSLQDGGRAYKEIKAGHWHTCGIDTSSRTRCWGYNHNGQTGKSRPWNNVWGPDYINTPPTTATAIDSFAHNCAAAEGSVYCWGNPGQYRLGNGGSNVWTPYKVPGLNQATAVTTGDRHSCAAVNSGRQVRCWGDNTQGQFGSPDASKSPTSYPAPTSLNLNLGSGTGSFQSDTVATGSYAMSSCALQSGDAYCWGQNDNGQLGDGSTVASDIPVKVNLGGDKVTQLAPSFGHTCALLESGNVKCWGYNAIGTLGNGTTTNSYIPVSVWLGANKAKYIATGAYSSCAILINDTLRCWGATEYGGMGPSAFSTTPVTIDMEGKKVAQVALGMQHSCARLKDSTVRCWGSNTEGQIGIGTTTTSQPTPISPNLGGLKVNKIFAGYLTSCAIIEDNSVRCWGKNWAGQAGTGSATPENILTPQPAAALSGLRIRDISIGTTHTCAILESDAVRCWGGNDYGQLGNGTGTSSLVPVTTGFGDQEVTSIAASLYTTCASMKSGATRCWGYAFLGNPAFNSAGSTNPIPVINPLKPIPSLVSAGNQHTCAIDDKENILCWGGNAAAELGDGTRVSPRTKPITVNTGGRKALEVSAGDQHTCAVLKDGTVLCWGFNSNGQIGQGNTSTTHYTSPVTVNLGGKKAVQVSVGNAHTCAVLEDGELKCWGWNSNGQIGNGSTAGTTQNRPTPVTVNLGGARAVQVSVGGWHTCVVLQSSTANGNAKCWGHNGNGKLGISSTTDQRSPVDVRLSGRRIKQISAGQYHTCAVLESEDALCWGYGGGGRVGSGSTANQNFTTPVSVSLSGNKVTTISAGEEHTCATLKNKSTRCWGTGSNYKLGYGNTTNYGSPVSVGHPGSSNTTYVSAGWTHTCAIISSQVRCWGGNATYQLGDGTNAAKPYPTASQTEKVRYEETTIY